MEESQFNKFKEDKLRVLLGKGHMVKQCTQPKRPRSFAWFKEKLMLAEEQEAGQILDEEQLVFIANPRIVEVQDVKVMPYSEQTHIDDYHDNEINSDSNIISYSQYLQESQDAAQRIKPTLYDGSVIAKEHNVMSMIDDEETLILEEECRSKMLDKQNDPISIKQKINISSIDYSKLNKIKEDFGKHFVSQKELSVEQAFWLKHMNYNPDTSVKSHTPVRIEAHSELSKYVPTTKSDWEILFQPMFDEYLNLPPCVDPGGILHGSD
nr:retrovirus-related Pol polyprotein from transposon TNT 1-94 [Tanacetum cinerariifolium]